MLALIVKLSHWIKIHHSKTNITSLYRSNKRVLLQHMGSTKELSFLESSLNGTSTVVLTERCKHYILYAWFTVKAHITDLLMKLANSTAQQDFVTPQHPFACIWALRCVVLCCPPSHGRCNFLNFFNYGYGVTNVCVPTWSQDPVHLKHYARDVTPTGQTNKRLKRGLSLL